MRQSIQSKANQFNERIPLTPMASYDLILNVKGDIMNDENIGIRLITPAQGWVEFTIVEFDAFREMVVMNQKINAIKMVRTVNPQLGLKEAKDFVEACTFQRAPVYVSPLLHDVLVEVKESLRSLIVSEYDVKVQAFSIYDRVTNYLNTMKQK